MKAGNADSGLPMLMAHRGHASRFPENTLEAIRAAADAGIVHIEFDVQITADHVPVLMHDASLLRTAGVDADVRKLSHKELRAFEVNYSSRFGKTYHGIAIPSLADAIAILQPGWTYYVEVKRESVEAFGVSVVMDAVLAALREKQEQCVLISFEYECLEYAQQHSAIKTGWVLRKFDRYSLQKAQQLAPKLLVVNALRLGNATPWEGDWQWASYEITDAEHALQLNAKGIDIISSMAAPELRKALLKHKEPER